MIAQSRELRTDPRCPNGVCGGTMILWEATGSQGFDELVCSLCARGQSITPVKARRPGVWTFRYVGTHLRLFGRVIQAKMYYSAGAAEHLHPRFKFKCAWSCNGDMTRVPTNWTHSRWGKSVKRYICSKSEGHRIWLDAAEFTWWA